MRNANYSSAVEDASADSDSERYLRYKLVLRAAGVFETGVETPALPQVSAVKDVHKFFSSVLPEICSMTHANIIAAH